MVDDMTKALSTDSNAKIDPSEFRLIWDYTSFTLAGKDSYSHQPPQPGSHEDSYYGSTDCAISATVAATNKISGSVNYSDNYSVANHWGSVYNDLSREWIFTCKEIALQAVSPDSLIFYSTGAPLKKHISVQQWTFSKPHLSQSASFKEFLWNGRTSPTLKLTFLR